LSLGVELTAVNAQDAGEIERAVTQPTYLPVQAPTKYELTIKLKTAKAQRYWLLRRFPSSRRLAQRSHARALTNRGRCATVTSPRRHRPWRLGHPEPRLRRRRRWPR